MSKDKITYKLNEDELHTIIREAYRNGYSTYEMVEAGLEPYNPFGYADYVMEKIKIENGKEEIK